MMSGAAWVFYILSAITLLSAYLAVSSRNLFRSAIYLMATLLGMAGFYFWMQVEFVAAVQIVVYAGGIAVLIIFSIFLTQQAGEKLPAPRPGRWLLAAFIIGCGLLLVYRQILEYPFVSSSPGPMNAEMQEIGKRMLSTGEQGYALPFELVSILLLAAMVGCIVIALRHKTDAS